MQDDDLRDNDDDDTGQAENNNTHGSSAAEDSQDEESSFEYDPDWRSLEESVEAKENDGDECYSSSDEDNPRNTLRCVLFILFLF